MTLSADEIVARVATIDVDDVLATLRSDAELVEGRAEPTLLSVTLDWVARVLPLLEPALGPAETWVATLAGGLAGPGGPILSMLVLLIEKAVVSSAENWAKKRDASLSSG